MPELTIQLRCDPATGKRDIVVKLQEDGELLPAEHERMHRTLVEKLLRAGVLKAGETGNLVIEREEGVVIPNPKSEATEGERPSESVGR